MRIRRTVAALVLATAAVLGTTAAAPAPSTTPARSRFPTGTATTADGRTVLTDRSGRALQLRGFTVDKYGETTESDLKSIAAHGFTLIRVAVSWTRLEPARDTYDRAELANLHQLLDWAGKYGLLAVIDFHQDVYGPKFGGGDRGIPLWATRDDGLPFTPDPDDWFAGYFQPAVQAAFRHLYDDPDLRRWQDDFYTRIARELGGHRALLGYDLFNEPSGPIDGDPSDPAVLAAASAELEQGRLAGMYQRLVAAVRQADSRSWLFVEPTVLVGQGVPTRLPAFSDPRTGAPRLGYAPHFYDTAVESGRDWDPADGFIENYTAAITAYPQSNHLPVLVGEWGPPNSRTPGNTLLVQRQVVAMEDFATAWTMWYWCRGNGGYCALGPDGEPARGDEPAFGPYARALAGLPLGESYRDGVYRLTFTADRAGGWTEVVLPAGSYPGRAHLTVSGARASAVVVEQPGAERSGTARVLLPPARPGAQITLAIG
ncbi:cellulase family glycosylhydrolase [Kitasatospora sp. GP82]|uniref:cellulase family glycosylhydrolase n=1 Tax=Kitasatospora sp. GP82 TaxID=3035089 RepID=UPI00247356D2|nr:cellulase family glycosylhydrolase [Kitasatospora sp. GP82]MDH6127816.1 endoglycosylceramidase [Kitasatospora sp. GP82]